jgi:beta-galactosidase
MSRRVQLNLNREWKFFRGDIASAQRVDFDDSSWQSIGLPHCFDLPYFRTPEFYVGYGWYRKRFSIPVAATPASPLRRAQECDEGVAATPRDHRVFLEFDGVFQVAEIFVNGHHAGEHHGGYTGFSFDITDFVHPGENLLAVRVNNNWNPQLAPRAGEHVFSGGIYRDVHLLITDPLHVAWNGITITTPQTSNSSGMALVCARVRNDHAKTALCNIQFQILHPDGKTVVEFASGATIQPGQTVEIEASPTIARTQLWHPDHPHLYRLRTQLFDARRGLLVDEFDTLFGFRWFEWTKDRGFFLNGEHLYLHGANAHQDHAGWGIGITRAACERDVKLIKEAGFNFVRGSHYPHHPAFADACDKHGLLFMPENCFWGKGGFGPEGYWNASAYPVNPEDFQQFEELCKQTLREMIRINRNHPSIIAWSMCNEPFFTYNLDRAKNLLRDLVQLSHELDPTRPAAIGGAQRGEMDKIGDIACYNGDGARLFIDPGVPSMVSEYGAIHKPHDAYEPFFGELQSEEFPWRSGQAIWCAFDYGTIAGKQGLKGILHHNRLPKRSWYCYRKQYRGIAPPDFPKSGVPSKLKLTADKVTIAGTDATDDVQIIVTVCDANEIWISNSPSITLKIESGPGEFPTGKSITFDETTDIQIINGQAAIAFRSHHGGASVIRATSPGLEDVTISITTIGSPWWESAGSPVAPSRPYMPPQPTQASLLAMQNQVNVALNRPCRASSETESHPARFANAGGITSFWRAADDDTKPWWQVDLEGFYQLSSSRLTFAAQAEHRYLIETSTDGSQWTVVSDKTQVQNLASIRNDVYPPGAVARYVRISFSAPAAIRLCEVEVFGLISMH